MNKPEILTSCVLNDAGGILHGFTTRRGGVSEGVYASLNIGISRGDKREHVEENYQLLAHSVGFDAKKIALTSQVHGDTVRIIKDGGQAYDSVTFSCDALITDKSGIALFVFTADCVPILLYDPVASCIGAVHAGWRGTANGILKKTVELMCSEYKANPANILAAIGPSIGRCCFEVDHSVYEELRQTYPEIDEYTDKKMLPEEKYYPDLKALNRVMLERCGVLCDSISISEACTKCDNERFWSHRRDGNDRGLQGGFIVLCE